MSEFLTGAYTFMSEFFAYLYTFMSEFEAKRPHLIVTPVKCSGHLTGTENQDAHARPTVQPTAIARIAAADLHEQNACPNIYVRVLGLQGKGMPKTESPSPAGAKGRGFAGAEAQASSAQGCKLFRYEGASLSTREDGACQREVARVLCMKE